MTKKQQILMAVALVLIAVLGRFLFHLPNATPLTAIALVGGVFLGSRWSIFLPLIALGISDMFIGGYEVRVMLSVYLSFALIGAIGWYMRKRTGPLPRVGAIITSSLLFFFITNAAVWAFSPWYAKDFGGLMQSYTLALPFLRNMLLGDLIYTPLLFAACTLWKRALEAREEMRGHAFSFVPLFARARDQVRKGAVCADVRSSASLQDTRRRT